MTRNQISEALGQISPRHIEEAADFRKRPALWKRAAALAACACLMLGLVLARHRQDSTAQILYGTQPPAGYSTHASLVYFTEEELFAREEMYAFRGRVLALENVTIDFNGDNAYRCIARMELLEVYRGALTPGEELTVLLPCPIDQTGELWIEDTDVITQLRVGMEGIFLPWVYDSESYWEQNSCTLMMQELAPCGLADGMRWAFLATDRGLVFEKGAYPSAASATDLDQIEAYVTKMLEQN